MDGDAVRIVLDAPEKLDLAEELREEFVADAKGAVTEAAQMLLDDIVRRLSARQGTRATVAPQGEAPEQDTGGLLRSFRLLPARVTGNTASAGIVSRHPGANRLENGFTDTRGIRTFPHPFVRPAIAATAGPITAMLQGRL